MKILIFLKLSEASGLVIVADCWLTVFVVVDEDTLAEVVTCNEIVNVAADAMAGIVRTGFCALADGENEAPAAEHVHDH